MASAAPKLSIGPAHTPMTPSGPPTTRDGGKHSAISDLVMGKMKDQFFIDSLVHDIVEKAGDEHIQRVYDGLAVEYTARALWAEMVALVKTSVVHHDPGYRSATEVAFAVASTTQVGSHHDPWRPDEPPARVITEDHSRRVVDIRNPISKALDASITVQKAKRGGGRPTSAGKDKDSVDDASARALLNVRSNSIKPSSRGSVDMGNLGASTAGRSSSIMNLTPTAANHPRGGLGGTIRSSVAPTSTASTKRHAKDGEGNDKTGATPEHQPLLQPEVVADELEVQEHKDRIARIAAERDEAAKRATKISKSLADPKTAPKNFTIDANGSVIPVTYTDDSKTGPLSELNSPRYQVAQNLPPQPPPEPIPQTTNKRPNRSTVQSPKDNGEKKKAPVAREGKKDEQYVSTDARDIPMLIKLVPSGGVAIKDNQGPPRNAELKTPSTKMSKGEYMRTRGMVANNSDATTGVEGNINPLLVSTVSMVKDSNGESMPTSSDVELANPSVAQLPVKRGQQRSEQQQQQTKKVPDQKAKDDKSGGVRDAVAQRVVPQAPAPPPQRDVRNGNAGPRRMLLDKTGVTPKNDAQLSSLAETWQGQRVVNKEKSKHRVTMGSTVLDQGELNETI